MSPSASHLFILDSNDKIIVKGLHSAYVEPLRSVLFNTFSINVEKNSQIQLQFTAYNDGSVAYSMLSVESSVFWDDQEYIIKQVNPDYANGFTTLQVTAIHVSYEIFRIRQRNTRSGTLTYTPGMVLSFFLSGNNLGFKYEVIGNFEKQQITDLGNGSGKDMLDKIISTWSDAVFYPDNKNIRIYQHDSFVKNLGNRIDYLHNTPDVKLTYDTTDSIVNQVMAYGKQKENTDSDKTEYYFEPFLVTDQKSVSEWGLHPGDDVSDERFTDKNAMKAYVLSQLKPEPTLSIDVTEMDNEAPTLGEIYRLEVRPAGFVTDVEVVGFTYYPLDKGQATSITLNNRAKTILNYKSAQQKALERALTRQQKSTKDAIKKAQDAYNSRLSGSLVGQVPYTPKIKSYTTSNSSVTLNIEAGKSTDKITEYVISCFDVANSLQMPEESMAVSNNNNISYTWTGLTTGNKYVFGVAARNGVGMSGTSTPQSVTVGSSAAVKSMPLLKAISTNTDDDIAPIYNLYVPTINAGFSGLAAGDKFYPQTTVEAIKGLEKYVADHATSYGLATHSNNGLMSSQDKITLDSLTNPVSSIKMVDSITGLIYALTITNGQIKIEEVNDG